MKKLPFLVLLFFVADTMPLPSKKKDERKVIFSAQLGGWWWASDTTGIIFVKTTLYNNSPDTLTYLRMTCSWADSYTTDNDSFNVIHAPCFGNGPIGIQLPPYKSEDEYLRIETKKNVRDWRNSKFRVGYNFVLLDTTRDDAYNVYRLVDMQHIVWSDTVQLTKFWKNY